MWTNKCTGCCELTTGSICNPRCCCSQSNDNIIGSDVCGWKQATVLKSLGIKESDLLYANFHNEVGVNPYLILLDTEWKTIVLAVRGTLSFEDMISDVTLTPKCLEETGEQFGFDGRGEYCHSGMYAGAKFIYDDLQRHKILDEAIEAHPDFGLRIIGHSLGAGVAAMLGRMLRQQYKNLYCLCFSPPGCVFSERTAKESKQYVCSVSTCKYMSSNFVTRCIAIINTSYSRKKYLRMVLWPIVCASQRHSTETFIRLVGESPKRSTRDDCSNKGTKTQSF